jgi:hypothetical protein
VEEAIDWHHKSITASSVVRRIHCSNSLAATRQKYAKLDPTQTSASLLLLEAFFLPWIGGVTVTLAFPESGLIARGDFDGLQPLGTLVEVAIRDHDTHRGAVRLLQFLTKEAVSKDHVLLSDLTYGNVAGIISGGLKNDKTSASARPDSIHDCCQANATPSGIQKSPASDTVNITDDMHLVQVEQLLVGKDDRFFPPLT